MSNLTDTVGRKLSTDQKVLALKNRISLKSVLLCG